jgi:two-component system, cell cycle sensor histidine kinase and response regulator CckA
VPPHHAADPAQPGDVTTGDAYRLLFEHVDNMVCTLDLEGRFRSLNAGGERLTGYSGEELRGRLAVELIAPEDRERAMAQFARRLASETQLPPDESVLLTKDGRRVPIEITSTLFVQDGRPVGVLGLVRDLSEQRRAEEALLQSESRFRQAFESAAIGMALVAPDGRFLQVNDSLCEIVGYTAEQIVAKTFQDITHPADLDADVELARRVLSGEIRTYDMEKRYFHRDGHEVWVLLSVSLVRASNGKPLHFIAQVQDVTEARRAQQTIERSEMLFAEAQQIAHVGSWERDLESGAMLPSEELCRIYGVDPETPDLGVEHFRARVHPDDRERVTAEITEAAQEGGPFALEYRVVHEGGAVRWLYGRGEAVIEDGRVVGIRGTAQDITERKQAEQRLADAEERYRTLVEQLPIGSYIRPLDMSQPNIYASPQVEPMLGFSAEDWQNDPGMLATVVHPDDRERVLGASRRVRTTGEPVHDEYRCIHREGHVVWVQDETFVVNDEHGEPAYVQGFLMDISERKRAEAERDRLRDELHHAQKLEAVGRLAGGVAHDFNNMLTAIRGYAELLLDGLPDDSPLQIEATQIKRAAEQAATLPRQLLAFSRKQTLEPVIVDLNEVVESTSDLLERLISETITFTTARDASHTTISVDPGQIEQVLVNLALNARDAMPDGGSLQISTGDLEVTNDSAAEYEAAPGTYVVLSVADTGHGMDEETRARAFEPFFTTKPLGEGSGLGLASVYGTVAQSGGFIRLETDLDKGTTFHIHFPHVTRGVEADAEAAPVDGGARPISVLLAEDEAIVRHLAVAVLERAGFDVYAAADGDEAFELFEQLGEIDVLLTDMIMPRAGGRELAERVLAASPGTPVVYMSGYTEEAPVGGATLLEKPFSREALVAAVEAAAQPAPQLAVVPSPEPSNVVELSPLTPREREVLSLLANGMTNDRAAAELGISAETVQSHVRNAMGKLAADTRTQAVATALRESLIA